MVANVYRDLRKLRVDSSWEYQKRNVILVLRIKVYHRCDNRRYWFSHVSRVRL